MLISCVRCAGAPQMYVPEAAFTLIVSDEMQVDALTGWRLFQVRAGTKRICPRARKLVSMSSVLQSDTRCNSYTGKGGELQKGVLLDRRASVGEVKVGKVAARRLPSTDARGRGGPREDGARAEVGARRTARAGVRNPGTRRIGCHSADRRNLVAFH